MSEKEYTYEEVEAALCVWEWINDVTLQHSPTVRQDWVELREGVGSCELRDGSMTLGKWALKVYNHCLDLSPGIFDSMPFDWEVIPLIMDYAVDADDGDPAYTIGALPSPVFVAKRVIKDVQWSEAAEQALKREREAAAASEPEVITNPCPWDEQPGHPVEDWQYEVANGDTRLGYLEWVAARTEIQE